MKKRLIIYTTILTLVALLLMFGLGFIVSKSNNNEITAKFLADIAEIYAEGYSNGNTDISEVDGDLRITVISSSGKVLVDTSAIDVNTAENHLYREEIQNAALGEPKAVTRYSGTLGREMMYYAVKQDLADGTFVFIRVAAPLKSISSYLTKTVPLTLMILFGILSVAFIANIFICEKLIKPFSTIKSCLIEAGKGKNPISISKGSYEEVNEVVSEIGELANTIGDNMNALTEEKTKLDYVVNNINDGIIAVSSDNEIVLANKKALNLFHATGDLNGKSIESLSTSEKLNLALYKCLNNAENSVFELALDKSVYFVTVKSLGNKQKNGDDGLAVAILSDITANKNNENLRSEFFANASHELKTPLTAILGFNEIVGLSNTDEKLRRPISQIASEGQRMLSLIDDMLKLSKLEQGSVTDAEPTPLQEIAKEVFESLSPVITEKKVDFDIVGNATVNINPKDAYELIKNLCENAVKYNVDGGKVTVSFAEEKNQAVLKVTDTGIGIDAKHQSRIFERFYRVEKSRSRASGGTGLGLSIVKHICLLYNAEISLKSQMGVGTTVQVIFNR